MKIYIVADTHFQHERLWRDGSRPENADERIIHGLNDLPKDPNSVVLHLGDISWQNDAYWVKFLRCICPGKLWLVRGNHDGHSDEFYIRNGFDWVGREFEIKKFGLKILFSHKPNQCHERLWDIDINIHGHLHNTGHHADEFFTNHQHVLVSMEELNYRPVELETLVNAWVREWK